MILLIDNFDSFTYNLLDYFEQLGEEILVRRNDCPISEIHQLTFDKLVLSPGPGKPKDAPLMKELIHTYQGKLPILGVCLGHQAIGEYFGWSLEKAQKPMHGKLSQISLSKDSLFENIGENSIVTRYHSLVLKKTNNTLEIIAQDESGEIMAIKHHQYSIYGIQFHPEAHLTKDGLKMLNNWLKTCDLKSRKVKASTF